MFSRTQEDHDVVRVSIYPVDFIEFFVGSRQELLTNNSKVVLRIQDNGHGMSKETLRRVGEAEFTTGKKGGSGIGVNHAKVTIEQEWQGSLEFRSVEGEGTTVEIVLPASELPPPILRCLGTGSYEAVLVVDDDDSIHAVWANRLARSGVKLNHVRNEADFDKWASRTTNALKTLILIDYELGLDGRSGIDLITKYHLHTNSILVTSHYNESRVNDYCLKNSIPLLPKQLAPMVPIKVG